MKGAIAEPSTSTIKMLNSTRTIMIDPIHQRLRVRTYCHSSPRMAKRFMLSLKPILLLFGRTIRIRRSGRYRWFFRKRLLEFLRPLLDGHAHRVLLPEHVVLLLGITAQVEQLA